MRISSKFGVIHSVKADSNKVSCFCYHNLGCNRWDEVIMADAIVPAPDMVPATGDPGDDTARRYRYQWTYAVIVCCMLLDDTEDVAEVFCEHHEDALMKHTDGMFSGLQVKTRSSNQEVWKTGDSAVRGLCAPASPSWKPTFPGSVQAIPFSHKSPSLRRQEWGRIFAMFLTRSGWPQPWRAFRLLH